MKHQKYSISHPLLRMLASNDYLSQTNKKLWKNWFFFQKINDLTCLYFHNKHSKFLEMCHINSQNRRTSINQSWKSTKKTICFLKQQTKEIKQKWK